MLKAILRRHLNNVEQLLLISLGLCLVSCGDSVTYVITEISSSSNVDVSQILSSSYASSNSEISSSSCTTIDGINSVTDCRDGQAYKTVDIGSQTWMVENLNYDTLNGMGSWCYNNDTLYCKSYGRLYSWVTAMAVSYSYSSELLRDSVYHKGICPSGWHVPRSSEWETMINFSGGMDSAGIYLQSGKSGFFAIMAGAYVSGFDYEGTHGLWWSASEYGSPYAQYWMMYSGEGPIHNSYLVKGDALSIRCIKD